MSFLLAVAHNFPRVSHCWVQDSVRQKELMDKKNYFLPVGYRYDF